MTPKNSSTPFVDVVELATKARHKLFEACPRVGAVLTLDPAHIGYLTGYRSTGHDLYRYYQMAALVSPERVALVLGAGDGPPASELLPQESLFCYGTFFVESIDRAKHWGSAYTSFDAALDAALGSILPEHCLLGLDHTGIPSKDQLTASLKNWWIEDITARLLDCRVVKLPGEIELLRHANRLLERGIAVAFEHAKIGVTECELAALVASEIVRGGGMPRSLTVTSGPRTALVDAPPSQRRLAHGDTLRLDLDCTYQGYWADIARTAFIGQATPKQETRFSAISTGLAAERQAIRPGVSAGELFRTAVDATRRAGLPAFDRHNCGHGIGVNSNERPRIVEGNQEILQPGMVICIETPYYEIEWGGMMTEQMMLVTENGAEPLTTLDATLRVL